MDCEKQSVYPHAGKNLGVSEGDWLMAAAEKGWDLEKRQIALPSALFSRLTSSTLSPPPTMMRSIYLIRASSLLSGCPLIFLQVHKANVMSLVSGPRADEPLGVKVKKDFQHTLRDYIAKVVAAGV